MAISVSEDKHAPLPRGENRVKSPHAMPSKITMHDVTKALKTLSRIEGEGPRGGVIAMNGHLLWISDAGVQEL